MVRVKLSNLILSTALVIYAIISKLVFDRVYLTSKIVVDEEFHLNLGEAYCNYEFHKWHPKITTFPGLYLLSSLLFGAFNLCGTYWLRLTSLLCSFINIILFYRILKINNDNALWQNVVSAINLALLPPLYFFSHLYYTDVPSITMMLAMFLLSQKGSHYFASIFGLLAVLFRQTNIVWVGMVFARYLIQELNLLYHKKSEKSKTTTIQEFWALLKAASTDLWSVIQITTVKFWLNSFCYLSLLIFFLLFLIFNGSIVVGDKTAHEATIHIPQLFYFGLFSLFFGWPHFLSEIFHFMKFIYKYRCVTAVTTVAFLVIVYLNTQVHPYMLADNRHYVFYVWNRLYGRYPSFRYLVVFFYLFSWFVIAKKMLQKSDVTFLLLFIPCTAFALVTQKLLELRYFFIPYILFRLNLKHVCQHALLYEFVTYLILNLCTFYIFFTKEIQWKDYDDPQRLIW